MSMTRPGSLPEQELRHLLSEILADLETALSMARNKPAKKLLYDRIGRIRRAIALAEPTTLDLTADAGISGRRHDDHAR